MLILPTILIEITILTLQKFQNYLICTSNQLISKRLKTITNSLAKKEFLREKTFKIGLSVWLKKLVKIKFAIIYIVLGRIVDHIVFGTIWIVRNASFQKRIHDHCCRNITPCLWNPWTNQFLWWLPYATSWHKFVGSISHPIHPLFLDLILEGLV